MSMRVVLVSHGMTAALRTAAFAGDEDLEPAALDAAAALELPFAPARAVVHTGPERRCQQTARALGAETSHAAPELRDWDSGSWRGRTLDDLLTTEPAAVQEWLQEPASAPHGGETLLALLQRAGAWLETLSAPSSRILAVTHPALVRGVAVHVLGAPPAAFWRLDVPPLSTLMVTGAPGRWSVRLH